MLCKVGQRCCPQGESGPCCRCTHPAQGLRCRRRLRRHGRRRRRETCERACRVDLSGAVSPGDDGGQRGRTCNARSLRRGQSGGLWPCLCRSRTARHGYDDRRRLCAARTAHGAARRRQPRVSGWTAPYAADHDGSLARAGTDCERAGAAGAGAPPPAPECDHARCRCRGQGRARLPQHAVSAGSAAAAVHGRAVEHAHGCAAA